MISQTVTRARVAAQADQLRRVVVLSENLAGIDEIGEACGRMYPRLHAALAARRVAFNGLSLALYQETADGVRPLRLTTALEVRAG
jgi:hypothetical protein